MLELKNICKTFNPGTINAKSALNDLSLTLADGDFVTVLRGPARGQRRGAREGLGIYLVIRLDCAYDGLRFVPLSPPLESGTVLAWKKTEVLSATAAALLRFAEKYVGGISDHPV